jgi:hypothetical protein
MPKGATKTSTNTSAAVALDWRDFNAVTPVVDQGSCGSCFTFSSAGAIEGASAIATGQLQELSKQQLLDCTRRAGNAGCRGGFMDRTFAWVVKNKGKVVVKILMYACIIRSRPFRLTIHASVSHDRSAHAQAFVTNVLTHTLVELQDASDAKKPLFCKATRMFLLTMKMPYSKRQISGRLQLLWRLQTSLGSSTKVAL